MIKKHNEKWPYLPDHQYRILIIRGLASGKTSALLVLISQIYLYAKDLREQKYEFFIKTCKDAGIKHLLSVQTL